MEPYEALWSLTEPYMGPYGALRSAEEAYGTSWSLAEPYGTFIGAAFCRGDVLQGWCFVGVVFRRDGVS